jgi:Mrp family chromosome partitioning ATPase/outer membrane murein-binding lipoprotein Lpp
MPTDSASLPQQAPAPKPAPAREASARVGDPRLRQIRNFIQQTEAQPFDIVKAVKSGLRGRVLLAVMIGAFLGSCLAVTIKVVVKPTYMSQGVLRLSARDQSILYNSMDDSRLRLFDAFTMGETNFITSRQVLDRALTIAKQKGIPDLPRDGASLESMLEVKGVKGLLTINATSRNPVTAAGVLNAVLDGYNQAHVDQYDERQDFRERELVARDKELLAKLASMDAEILDIGGEYGAGSIAKAHNEKLAQVQELSTRIAELEAQIAGIDSRDPRAGAARQDAELATQIATDSAIATLTLERMKKVSELKVLAERYTPENKRMQAAQSELEIIDQALAERTATIERLAQSKDGDEDIKVDGKSPEEIKGYLSRLKERRDAYAAEAKVLNSRSVNLTFLEEERAQTRELLDESRKALEQVRLERRNMSLGPAQIVERGAIPNNPHQDKSKQLMGVAFFGGFGVSFVLFIVYGIVRPRIRHEDDVKALGKGVALAGILSPDGKTGVHKLRNTLQLALGDATGTGRSLAVMSLHSGANAGMVAKALGHSYADSGSHTMVIDADLKTPQLTFSFGHAELTGLRDFIAGGEAMGAVRSGSIDVLPTGRGNIDDDSLSLSHVRKLIDTASTSHELVIVDCGEVEARLAASLFAAESDLVVGVVRQDSSESDVRLAVSRLNAITQRPVQVVYVTDPDYKRKPITPEFIRAPIGKLLASLKPQAAVLIARLQKFRKEKKP